MSPLRNCSEAHRAPPAGCDRFDLKTLSCFVAFSSLEPNPSSEKQSSCQCCDEPYRMSVTSDADGVLISYRHCQHQRDRQYAGYRKAGKQRNKKRNPARTRRHDRSRVRQAVAVLRNRSMSAVVYDIYVESDRDSVEPTVVDCGEADNSKDIRLMVFRSQPRRLRDRARREENRLPPRSARWCFRFG